MPTLKQLGATFLRYKQAVEDGKAVVYYGKVETIAEAQGVRFLCPLCFEKNGGEVGTHSVICWSRSRGTPEEAQPGPGRWRMDGTSLDDLTLNADPPSDKRSVQLNGGCAWHGFITKGCSSNA